MAAALCCIITVNLRQTETSSHSSDTTQRGAIENTNGIIRRDMPRKTDITNYTLDDINELTWAINSTPRKCLGFKTPAEAFLENMNVALEM